MFRRRYILVGNLTRDKKWARRQPVLYAWDTFWCVGNRCFPSSKQDVWLEVWKEFYSHRPKHFLKAEELSMNSHTAATERPVLLFYSPSTGVWLHNPTSSVATMNSFLLLWILRWEHCRYFRYLGKGAFLELPVFLKLAGGGSFQDEVPTGN